MFVRRMLYGIVIVARIKSRSQCVITRWKSVVMCALSAIPIAHQHNDWAQVCLSILLQQKLYFIASMSSSTTLNDSIAVVVDRWRKPSSFGFLHDSIISPCIFRFHSTPKSYYPSCPELFVP